MSHRQQVQQDDAKAQARLLRLLQKSEAWLYELRYEYGMAWLSQHFGFDPRLEQALATMPCFEGSERNLFWSWYLNDWQHSDQLLSLRVTVMESGSAYCSGPEGRIKMIHTPADLKDFYCDLHHPKNSLVKLPAFVLEAARCYLRDPL